MEALLGEIFTFLLANYALYVVVIMGVLMAIIYFVLNLVKKPIKKLTSKIQSERIRHGLNTVIIVLSFGFSALFWFLLHYFVPQYFAFNGVEILWTGAAPVVLYAVVDGWAKKDETAKDRALKVVKTVKEIVSDGKVDKKEAKNAEEELNKLLKK